METQEILGGINNSTHPEITFHCRLCRQHKSTDCFHTYGIYIGNTTHELKYIDHLCKDCLPIESLYWSSRDNKPRINQKIFSNTFRRKEYDKFYQQYRIRPEDLISRPCALELLGLDNDNHQWFGQKVKMGILDEYILATSPGDYNRGGNRKPIYQRYYLPEQIELLQYIKQNGFLICRGQKSVKRGVMGQNNPPFQFINKKGKHYLFVNLVERKKSCAICCEYKSFDDFDNSNNTKDNRKYICRECASIENKNKYELLGVESLAAKRAASKEYIKKNKERVKLCRRLYRKTQPMQCRIRANLRNRIKNLLKAKRDHNIDYLDKIHNGEYKLPSSERMLGTDPIQFLNYLESKFINGMTWENYGKDGWEIDHIRCIDSFDLHKIDDIMKVNHYTNLLPMWAADNNKKRDKLTLHPIKDQYLLDKYPDLQILINEGNNNDMNKLIMTKECCKCKQDKPLEDFRNQAKGKYGKKNYCKICDDINGRANYEKNRDKRLNQVVKWNKENGEKLKEYQRRFNERKSEDGLDSNLSNNNPLIDE